MKFRQWFLEQLKVKKFRHHWNMRLINVTVALQVRSMRKKRGWSQRELALRCGLAVPSINRIEQFYWKIWPSISTLLKIANAFDCGLIVNFSSWSELVDRMLEVDQVEECLRTELFCPKAWDEEYPQ